jgi:hypothetical protein
MIVGAHGSTYPYSTLFSTSMRHDRSVNRHRRCLWSGLEAAGVLEEPMQQADPQGTHRVTASPRIADSRPGWGGLGALPVAGTCEWSFRGTFGDLGGSDTGRAAWSAREALTGLCRRDRHIPFTNIEGSTRLWQAARTDTRQGLDATVPSSGLSRRTESLPTRAEIRGADGVGHGRGRRDYFGPAVNRDATPDR